MQSQEEWIPLDPRTIIILLIFANVIAFTQKSIYVEIGVIAALFIFMLYCGCFKEAVKLVLLFIVIDLFKRYIFSKSLPVFVTIFAMMSVYIRKIIPCLMIATVILKKIPMKYIILAMRKWRFPHKFIISLSVTLRYFPAIRQESRYIKDAMKLRNIKGIKMIEYFMIPLMMSAIGTAEELSAAAVTRGIENPIEKTSLVNSKFMTHDWIILIIGIILVAITLVMGVL
ncbi:MAG: energy-coupling factor transporter transmembrane protein EcfT [Tepidibacter sp.]|jgi:energy-coupling factor transport system permease protein|uniref:energy-coupling factor transporter transmembrane component T n=1 Tax=Tepidibacter sp. TaxID=2529387 RepID=UPI0025E924D8|nr:energy-coupling factor transporter transmembrane component T [Tepidibacter sp.]MCT4509300.1 energy-coupling factor transporter transmembrane protein EcfT [Tepidibacter sp.]